jgi:hypothetical protein
MFTVSADFDDDIYHIYPLPKNLAGTLYIKVEDTLRSPGSYDRDTLYIDHLFIRTDNEPDSLPFSPGSLAATGLTFDSIALDWLEAPGLIQSASLTPACLLVRLSTTRCRPSMLPVFQVSVTLQAQPPHR